MADKKVDFIGCLKIPEGIISLDYSNIELSPIIPHQIRLKSLYSETLEYNNIEYPKEELKKHLAKLTMLAVRWIETNRVSGKLILYYEKEQLRWDIRIICTIYRA